MNPLPQKNLTINEISDQLAQEEEWLKTLTGSVERSEQLKQSMLDILDSFSRRLSDLEGTVLPLYEHTGQLQQRQMNISKTLKAIDSTLAHYTSVAELDSSLRNAEPSEDVGKYLKNMDKLKEAMKYFSTENSNASHLENAKGAFEFGCSALEREFKEILRKDSKSLIANVLLDAISDDYEINVEKLNKIDLLPVRSVELLAKLAQWLVANGTALDFADFYCDQRSQVFLKSLQNVSEHMKSRTPPAGLKPQQSPMHQRRELSVLKSQGLAITKKISVKPYASDAANRRTTTLAVENVTKESSLESEAENFILILCCSIIFVTLENDLLQRIFGAQKELTTKLMRNLINKPISLMLMGREAFLAQIQRSLNKNDHAAVLSLLPISRYLHLNDRRFDIIYKFSSMDLKKRFVELLKSVDGLCTKGLEEFVEHVKSDDDKFVPKDGTVHQLTSNALTFMEQLMHLRDCLAVVLSVGQPEVNQGLVPKYFARILSALGLNLRNKAEFYTAVSFADFLSLKCLFMLNNYNHILKTLQKTGLMKLVCQQNREVENYYYEQIRDYRRQYIASWNRLLVILLEYQQKVGVQEGGPIVSLQQQGAKLKDKEREGLKSAFADFNKEFEVMISNQMCYSVPDAELAAQLRKEIKELVLPKYAWFYNNYHAANFTKNPEKYVKYTTQDVLGLIGKLFMR